MDLYTMGYESFREPLEVRVRASSSRHGQALCVKGLGRMSVIYFGCLWSFLNKDKMSDEVKADFCRLGGCFHTLSPQEILRYIWGPKSCESTVWITGELVPRHYIADDLSKPVCADYLSKPVCADYLWKPVCRFQAWFFNIMHKLWDHLQIADLVPHCNRQLLDHLGRGFGFRWAELQRVTFWSKRSSLRYYATTAEYPTML